MKSIVLRTSTLWTRKGSSGVREKRCSLFEAAAGVEEDLFVGDLDVHAEVLMCAEIIGDHIGEVMRIDDDFAECRRRGV